MKPRDADEEALVRAGQRRARVAVFWAAVMSVLTVLLTLLALAFDAYREWIIWTQ